MLNIVFTFGIISRQNGIGGLRRGEIEKLKLLTLNLSAPIPVYVCNLSLVVLIILVSTHIISLDLFNKSSRSGYVLKYQESLSRHIRYLDSLASFKEMLILDKKSFLLCPSCASLTLAPTLVPLLKSWLVRINSLCSFAVCLQHEITIIANAYDSFSIWYFFFGSSISWYIITYKKDI